jgi:hypothetical protein
VYDLRTGDEVDPRGKEMGRVFSLINTTAPTTMAGVLVKLRLLADPDNGIEAGDRADDVVSLWQILAFLEQEARP